MIDWLVFRAWRKTYQEFLICCSISERVCLQCKALILSTTWGILLGDGSAEGFWRHKQWSPSLILPRIRNQVRKSSNLLCLTWKITQISTLQLVFKQYDQLCRFHYIYLVYFCSSGFDLIQVKSRSQFCGIFYCGPFQLMLFAFELFNCLAKVGLQKLLPNVNRVNWCQVVEKVTIYHR